MCSLTFSSKLLDILLYSLLIVNLNNTSISYIYAIALKVFKYTMALHINIIIFVCRFKYELYSVEWLIKMKVNTKLFINMHY